MIQQTVLAGLGFMGMAVGNIPNKAEKLAAQQKQYETTQQYVGLQKEEFGKRYEAEKKDLEYVTKYGTPEMAKQAKSQLSGVESKYYDDMLRADLTLQAQQQRLAETLAANQRDKYVRNQLKGMVKDTKQELIKMKANNKMNELGKEIKKLEDAEEFKKANKLQKQWNKQYGKFVGGEKN